MNPMRPLLFSSSACGIAALFLAGCGGGGSSGPSNPNPTPAATPSSTPSPTATPIPGNPRILLDDQFDGAALDGGKWGTYSKDQTLQRTKFGFTPAIVSEGATRFARMRLDSFNPDSVGSFKGTEIFSRQRFPRGNGLEMTARLRAPGLPPGIIVAFFGIHDRYEGTPSDDTYRKDEIDYEILTAQQEQFSPPNTRNRLYLNVWNDWNLRNQFDENDGEDGTNRLNDDKTYAPAKAPGYDYANWNIYTIRWYPDRTEFYLNGVLERTEREVRPDEDLSVHFNMWTGITDFRLAYSASLQPANSAAANASYTFDVDYVVVRDLTGTSALSALKLATPPAARFKSYRSR